MKEMLQRAKAAKYALVSLTTEQKNDALARMAAALIQNSDAILAENQKDLEAAKGSISEVMLDRLALSPARIEGMADGIRALIDLPDPVGRKISEYTRPDGLKINKVSVPMGVVAIIYESRPNVTSDAAALALKSGNVCILRGGKEAFRSANAIVKALREGLMQADITPDAVQLVQDISRASATELMKAEGFVDLLIPRGGKGLIRSCIENATVPLIATGTGICHIYVEQTADLTMALDIIENAKCSRPSVCNAMEVLVVDKALAPTLLPLLKEKIGDRVEFIGESFAADIIPVSPATSESFDTEFLDYKMAIRCVDGYADAIAHINAHSTGHSEAILSQNDAAIAAFTAGIDSAAVYVNASTRFTDGGEFGLGCEMGISTQKLHARGPMGLFELTTYKYIIEGKGQVR